MTKCELLVLAALPSGLPGLRQQAIRNKIAHRVAMTPGAVLPSREDVRDAIASLRRKGIVHSERRVDAEDGFEYFVYWRDAAYVAPLDVGVAS